MQDYDYGGGRDGRPMDCIFCKIAAGEIPANKVLDEPDLVAFHDLHAQAPVHVLVIPREHIDNVARRRAGARGAVGPAAAGGRAGRGGDGRAGERVSGWC